MFAITYPHLTHVYACACVWLCVCVSWSSRVCRLSHRVKVLLWVIGQCGKVIWLACRSSLYINVAGVCDQSVFVSVSISLYLYLRQSQTQMDKLFWRKIVSAVQRAIAAGSTCIYMSIYTTSGIAYIHLFVFPRNILALHGSLSPLASKWNQMLHRRHGQTAGAEAGAGAGREQEQA